MSLSVNSSSPVGYASPPSTTQSNDGASFEQLLKQLASDYGISPQELFNLITSNMNPSPGSSVPTSAPSAAGGGSGSGSNEELKEVLGQFASNTLNAGNGMMKEAMEKFFQEEEPDEDDPDAEPL